ncbi:ActS/PrrB/RegB family redox-sensitive histidine kinase [Roseovarius sp. SCSIO 43702]|uniref:sensor histidine kinase RegB n=1 Tax=Roseovarius sp. SCSIO 43702 TaxID=2823043 RepID=UPI001C73C78A|nr:ActS/PrrB/RegB family redox-sensitive histidine kinase [Roseovarius sp. SCSIO 43702]QYX58450.1 ActS/PrrB/RegB family redox-sensitive histidine kinase [Roseovarius sp. SCSIO 43702]
MDSQLTGLAGPRNKGHWIRLRTLVLLRWWAVLGQVTALVTAHLAYGLVFDIGLCFAVIGASVVSNLAVSLIYPANKRLDERENLVFVMFDLLQLGLLLYLTGGLNNPFAILVVGPVVVSASSLSARSTLFLGLTAIGIVTLLLWLHLPLRTVDGDILRMPWIYRFGFWLAIVIAVVFLGVYSRWVVSEMQAMSQALQATQMALAREQKLTDLGGVVAAAAHELGTPLATIKLTSSELAEELPPGSDAHEDALLIRDQADRCRDILRSMGRAGKEDRHLRTAPLSALLDEAAEPHLDRGKTVVTEHGAGGDLDGQPVVLRRPEIIHGLRNLIQNAVDFARDAVWIESRWTADRITIRIMDNGPGFPPALMTRIGEPFVRRRFFGSEIRRPHYEGMGLGLFIAKTLLERSGADLSFANGSTTFGAGHRKSPRSGAVVEVVWPRSKLEVETSDSRAALGKNENLT